MTKRASICLALALTIVAVASCSDEAGDIERWCESYGQWVEALVDADAAAPGSAEYEDAAERGEGALAVLVTVDAPAEIRSDYVRVLDGPDPGDAGPQYIEAGRRVADWALSNCSFSSDFVNRVERADGG